jgi:hypothetical protein
MSTQAELQVNHNSSPQAWCFKQSVGEFRKTRHPRNVRFDKVLETCFSGQGTHDFRRSGTCEASDSRICEVRGSWFGEDVESRTCRSPEPRVGGGANFGGRLIRESVGDPVRESRVKALTNWRRSKGWFGNLSGDPVRESRVKTFTNRRRSKVKVVVPKSSGFECELVADL